MTLIRLPGLVDCHVHLRDPGAVEKEDFASGGRAAIAGGITYMLDMPNNAVPTTTVERLEDKIRRSRELSAARVGFHFGTDGTNLAELPAAAAHPGVFGLKVYFDSTTGDLMLDDLGALNAAFAAWDSEKPVLAHAEGTSLAAALGLAAVHRRRLHVCHVSRADEVDVLRAAKAAGTKVTAGVCPHHLFLTAADVDRLGSHARMKPPLGDEDDRDALWAGLDDGTLDVVETDHAPHTLEEKASANPPFGVPGLETSLALMLSAVRDGRLTLEDVTRLMADAPRAIFAVPEQPETWIEVDLEAEWVVGADGYRSRCGWSPFAGWVLPGPVRVVTVDGRPVLVDGRFVT